jgi:hypothetical protein
LPWWISSPRRQSFFFLDVLGVCEIALKRARTYLVPAAVARSLCNSPFMMLLSYGDLRISHPRPLRRIDTK